ncbi:MAG: LLM class flavin-dependent oxidoreductase [Acidimicrobiia bacterium]|nr:LLM class flavin-dependent oxidoreductase [Acidimicrobiia bacterium]
MRVGISITSGYRGTTAAEAVNTVIERARVAAAAGLDHLSLGDHHVAGPDGLYVQNVPMVGRLMADWPADRPIGCLFLLPLWHPVLVAEQIGTLAAMSDVPFIVQTGIGWGDAEFAAFGRRPRERGAVTDEAIRVIKGLLAGETVSSERLNIVDAAIGPCPPHGVEWWIGAGTGDRPLGRAAAQGDAWYIGPAMPPDQLPTQIERYRSMCAAAGTAPRVIVRRDVFITDDDAEGLRRGREMVAAGYRGMTEDVLIYGGVDRAVDRLSALAESGVDDVVVRTMSVGPAEALRSIELTGEARRRLLGG